MFEAWDSLLAQLVAIKLLTGSDANRPSLRRRLRAETQAMRGLRHPNVLRVYDLRRDGDLDYVVMDLATGGSLQDRIDAHGPLPVEEAVGYVQQVLSALSAAHAAGVVHRDVKPQNVLLDSEGVALLADFGIARLAHLGEDDRRTRAGVAMGSFAFMPPEQRLDAREVDGRADVYAAGATLYALLTAGNPVDLFTAGADSVRWAGIPHPIAAAIRGATAQERTLRFPDPAAFSRALGEALHAVPPAVRAAPIVVFPDLPAGASHARSPAWQRATAEAVTYLSGGGESRGDADSIVEPMGPMPGSDATVGAGPALPTGAGGGLIWPPPGALYGGPGDTLPPGARPPGGRSVTEKSTPIPAASPEGAGPLPFGPTGVPSTGPSDAGELRVATTPLPPSPRSASPPPLGGVGAHAPAPAAVAAALPAAPDGASDARQGRADPGADARGGDRRWRVLAVLIVGVGLAGWAGWSRLGGGAPDGVGDPGTAGLALGGEVSPVAGSLPPDIVPAGLSGERGGDAAGRLGREDGAAPVGPPPGEAEAAVADAGGAASAPAVATGASSSRSSSRSNAAASSPPAVRSAGAPSAGAGEEVAATSAVAEVVGAWEGTLNAYPAQLRLRGTGGTAVSGELEVRGAGILTYRVAGRFDAGTGELLLQDVPVDGQVSVGSYALALSASGLKGQFADSRGGRVPVILHRPR